MRHLLRVMRLLTAVAVLIAILLICWQVIDVYITGFNAAATTADIYRAEDIAARIKAVAAPLGFCGLVCGTTIILHLLIAGEGFSMPSVKMRVHTSNKVFSWRFQQHIRILALCVAIVFILLGVMNGSAYDVLVKAINICTECIGLG